MAHPELARFDLSLSGPRGRTCGGGPWTRKSLRVSRTGMCWASPCACMLGECSSCAHGAGLLSPRSNKKGRGQSVSKRLSRSVKPRSQDCAVKGRAVDARSPSLCAAKQRNPRRTTKSCSIASAAFHWDISRSHSEWAQAGFNLPSQRVTLSRVPRAARAFSFW